LLLKHLEILGRAEATMPSRQADLDLKSAGRKNQNKRPVLDLDPVRRAAGADMEP
jgi:hypothetical protein